MITSIWAIIVVNITNIMAALGSIYIKKSTKIKISVSSLFRNMDFIKGGLLYILGTVLFIPALKYGELSVLYPFVALSYIWAVLFSIRFLKERMNSLKWIGVFLILIGVLFISI